ncbi:MAG: VOC family protein [Patescibacteria group bacterium]
MRYFHTSISVNDLQESREFYESVFNLKFRSEGERKEMKSKFLNLEDENHNVVELFKHDNPIPLSDDLMDMQKVGIKHLAFIVDNIEEVIEHSSKYKSKVIWPPQEGITLKRIAFISDPNGIPIELVELKD